MRTFKSVSRALALRFEKMPSLRTRGLGAGAGGVGGVGGGVDTFGAEGVSSSGGVLFFFFFCVNFAKSFQRVVGSRGYDEEDKTGLVNAEYMIRAMGGYRRLHTSPH